MSQCKKFTPNIFHKTKCSNCFRQKEEHSAEALECNRASRSIARSGYLFVAPDWDFSVPLNRTKRWQRRWFVLYDDGELNYSVDEHPETVPQGSVDMCKVMEVTGAEQVTGHPHSLALTSPDRVTFVKAASREDARWWAELLAVFPRRHKRNATFPGGRASPSLPQLGRSASPQPPRPRRLSVTGPSPRANFETPPLKEERESPPKEEKDEPPGSRGSGSGSGWMPDRTGSVPIDAVRICNDYTVVSSGSPPTRDKLRCDDKARARRDWRNERLRDIATALTDRSPEPSLALPAEGLLHLKKGWLWMRRHPDGEWLRRWIVLCGPTLQAFREQDERAAPELVVELSTVTGHAEVATDSKYGFEIRWAGPTLTLSAVTQGIRSNWLQALKKAAPMRADSPVVTPSTPRSMLASSDEEYRTASEGGRRGSEDWSELPPSPPPNRLSLGRAKDRSRLRPRLPRCQSRQSTVDSTSTDELDCAKDPDAVDKHVDEAVELRLKLGRAEDEVRVLEEEIARLKKFQSDAAIREKKAKETLSNLERSEAELNQRNAHNEVRFVKEQRALQRRLSEAEETAKTWELKCDALSDELSVKQRALRAMQDELSLFEERLDEQCGENEGLREKVRELEAKCCPKGPAFRGETLAELADIRLDVDLESLDDAGLREYCSDLRCRFEKAIAEIRVAKRALKEADAACDKLELENYGLRDGSEALAREHRHEVDLLVARLDHLTAKLATAERQLKSKAKAESKDKRRSLSLKGRESFSINKEVEDKVTELEAKIIALERGKTTRRRFKRDRSSERASPIDDRTLRRLRRKSLDSATSSEPMKLLMRLSSLESKVSNANVNASNESLNLSTLDIANKLREESPTLRTVIASDFEQTLTAAKVKVNECLSSVHTLRNSRKRAPSPSDRLDRLVTLENTLNELRDILNNGKEPSGEEAEVINSSAAAVVKQLQKLLIEKLASLTEKKRVLREKGELNPEARLQLLAEKVAYENILIGRIQEALSSPATGEAVCDRLIGKETRETAFLMISLQNKLDGGQKTQQQHFCRTGADYLAKVLAKCLATSTEGSLAVKNFVSSKTPSLDLLLREKKKLDRQLESYKATKLPQLAQALAAEAMSLSSDKSCRIRPLDNETIGEFAKAAREAANAELLQSEINHVLLRAAQVYQTNVDADHAFFFSFFASERAALELWADSVGDLLYKEIDESVNELSELYQSSVSKLQKQNWRRRVELERGDGTPIGLLHNFADVVAHKALIDARIAVLNGSYSYSNKDRKSAERSLCDWLENEKHWACVEAQPSLRINQSLEAEFNCMLDKFGHGCNSALGRPGLEEIVGYLDEIAEKMAELRRFLNVPGNGEDAVAVISWGDVCAMCVRLKDDLEDVCAALGSADSIYRRYTEDRQRPLYLGTEYLAQVENLRAAYRCALAACKERRSENDIEQLQQLCERVLASMEQWHYRTIHDLREAHSQEVDMLKQEKEQALAEETQATLAALDAMRKAHVAEVQREVVKFKQEFARQQRDNIFDLSEQLSVKSLEAAALEEQLGSATRQLAHAQQHILHLERNPRLSTAVRGLK